MDKNSDDNNFATGRLRHPTRVDVEFIADDAESTQPVFILNARLEFTGFNPSFVRAFSGLCNRAPLLHEPVSIIPFYALNLAGEEWSIDALCRNAVNSGLLKAKGWLRLADRNLSVCLEFIAVYDACGDSTTLVITMFGLSEKGHATPLPKIREPDASWEKLGHESSGITSQDFQTTFNLAAVGIAHPEALRHLLSLLSYVSGDYNDPATFEALGTALGAARRPAYYLAIPPALFGTVITALGASGLAEQGRIIVEKPFGRDLASARELNRVAQSVFPEEAIFRIDHFLAKEAIMNILYFRFANAFLESIWNLNHVANVQVTLSVKFGAEGRGSFYETASYLCDVIQSHLFQIVALLAMEPPSYRGFAVEHGETADAFHAMRPLTPRKVVRVQYVGYRQEVEVAGDSDVGTFCAARLFIDSWLWGGIPWYLRSGKCLAETVSEVIVLLKPPPQQLFADSGLAGEPGNFLRFRLSPCSTISLAARVKRNGKAYVGDQRELSLVEDRVLGESPYERLLGDAMAGNGALFTREDAVEAAWAAVDPVLTTHHATLPYAAGTWGPEAADALIAADGGWFNPEVADDACN